MAKIPKKGTTARLIYDCVEKAKKIVRKKGYCERCGKRSNLQGSHIVSVGVSKRLSSYVQNILCLCVGCHLYRWHKEPVQAARRFEQKRPGRYDALVELGRGMGSLGKLFWEERKEKLDALDKKTDKIKDKKKLEMVLSKLDPSKSINCGRKTITMW